jgi:hypothetical protein
LGRTDVSKGIAIIVTTERTLKNNQKKGRAKTIQPANYQWEDNIIANRIEYGWNRRIVQARFRVGGPAAAAAFCQRMKNDNPGHAAGDDDCRYGLGCCWIHYAIGTILGVSRHIQCCCWR